MAAQSHPPQTLVSVPLHPTAGNPSVGSPLRAGSEQQVLADAAKALGPGWQVVETLGDDPLFERILAMPQVSGDGRPRDASPSTASSYPPGMYLLCRLHPALQQEAGLRESLLEEASVGQQLYHPNFARMLEPLDAPGGPWQVLEAPNGVLLSQLMAYVGRALPASIAAEITRQLCEGVSALEQLTDAHGAPLVPAHLNLHPDNICIDSYGDVKLLSLGITPFRLAMRPGWREKLVRPPYQAPEMLRSDAGLSASTSQYSIGVMAFEMLCGVSLQLELEALARESGASTRDGLEQSRRQLPSRLHEVTGLPAGGLNTVLARMLGYEPSQRFATLVEAGNALLQAAWGLNQDSLDYVQYIASQVHAIRGEADGPAQRPLPDLQVTEMSFLPAFDPTLHGAPAPSERTQELELDNSGTLPLDGSGTTEMDKSQTFTLSEGEIDQALKAQSLQDGQNPLTGATTELAAGGIWEPAGGWDAAAPKETTFVSDPLATPPPRDKSSDVSAGDDATPPQPRGLVVTSGKAPRGMEGSRGNTGPIFGGAASGPSASVKEGGGSSAVEGIPGTAGMAPVSPDQRAYEQSLNSQNTPGMAGTRPPPYGMPPDGAPMPAGGYPPGAPFPSGNGFAQGDTVSPPPPAPANGFALLAQSWNALPKQARLGAAVALMIFGVLGVVATRQSSAPSRSTPAQSAGDVQLAGGEGPGQVADPVLRARLEEPLPDDAQALKQALAGRESMAAAGAAPAGSAPDGSGDLPGREPLSGAGGQEPRRDETRDEEGRPLNNAPSNTQSQTSTKLAPEILKPFRGKSRHGIASVTIDSTPPDSVIILNGQDIERTPISIEDLPAGELQIILRNEEYGYRDVVVIDLHNGQHFSGTWSFQNKKWLPQD